MDGMDAGCTGGIFGAPGIPKEAQEWYVQVLKKVTETPEWQAFTDNGGLKRAFLSGPDLRTWLETTEALHQDLMAKRQSLIMSQGSPLIFFTRPIALALIGVSLALFVSPGMHALLRRWGHGTTR